MWIFSLKNTFYHNAIWRLMSTLLLSHCFHLSLYSSLSESTLSQSGHSHNQNSSPNQLSGQRWKMHWTLAPFKGKFQWITHTEMEIKTTSFILFPRDGKLTINWGCQNDYSFGVVSVTAFTLSSVVSVERFPSCWIVCLTEIVRPRSCYSDRRSGLTSERFMFG